jgi:hypothetical protein
VLGLLVKMLFSSAISAGIHAYLWLRLIRPAHLSRRWHRVAMVALIVLWLSIPIATASRMYAPGVASALGWVAFPWMALAGLTFVTLVAFDIAHLITRIGQRAVARPAGPRALSRRQFLTRVTGGAALAVGSGSVASGMIEARGEHAVVDVEIKLARLPRALDGFTIVQLSDLHTGMTIDRAFVQRVVDHTNRLSPDLIALTGDLVDGKVEDLRDDVAPLGQLRARHGVFAVTGNHEYYSGADPWIAEISRLGARYLRNERVRIGDGERRAARRRSAAVGTHARRSDLAVALHRAAPAGRAARRTLPAGRHAALRLARLRLLGPAGPRAGAARDHAHHPARRLTGRGPQCRPRRASPAERLSRPTGACTTPPCGCS